MFDRSVDVNRNNKLTKREVIEGIVSGKLIPISEAPVSQMFDEVLPEGGEVLFQHFTEWLNVHFTIP
eukprot:scaffold92568_cov34-Prasinocladus_malaysianus.AAC.1